VFTTASALTTPQEDIDNILSLIGTNIIPRDVMIEYLRGYSILTIEDEDVHPSQTSFILDLSDTKFSFQQDKLHDNDATAESTYSMRFTVPENDSYGQNQTAWIRAAKNVTLTGTSMTVEGLTSSSTAAVGSKVHSIDISEQTAAFSKKEIVIGSDDGRLSVYSSSGTPLAPLIHTFDYPVYAVAAGDVTTCGREDLIAGVGNGTLYVYCGATQSWNYSYSPYPIYVVTTGDITDSAREDIVFGTWDHKVVLVNGSGNLIWNYTAGSEVHGLAIGNLTADSGNEIVVGSYDGYITVLNATGHHIWNFSAGGWVLGVEVGDYNSSSPGNEVLFGSNNFSFYVLNSSGSLLWSYETENYVSSLVVGDILTDDGNEVVAGSWDKTAYTINSTAERAWNTTTGGFVLDVAIGELFTEAGNELAIASADGTVYVNNYRYFTVNPFIEVANSSTPNEWSYTGKYLGTETFGNYTTLLQNYLDNNCSDTETMCDIPLMGHSDESGVLQLTSVVNFSYDATAYFNQSTIDKYSKTQYINVNETIGSQILNIAYIDYPIYNITVNYIKVGASATQCDFNGEDYSVIEVGGVKVCDLSNSSRVIPNNDFYALPSADEFWEDSMPSLTPALMNETAPTAGSGYWRKNLYIWNTTDYPFRDIIAETTVDDTYASVEIHVDWNNNGSYVDITPEDARSNCNTDTPTYNGMPVGDVLFYVCKQDTDNDTVVDYFKWMQPYLNDTTSYQASSSLNYPPVAENDTVTPLEGLWNTLFNYSIDVYDQDGDKIFIRLYTKKPGGEYTLSGSTEVTGNGTIWFNLTSDETWTGINSFYFQTKDPNHLWKSTTAQSLPVVTKHHISFEEVIGNNTNVSRRGSESVTVSAKIRDTDTDHLVPPGVDCMLWTQTSETQWDAGQSTVSDSNGVCEYAFDPGATYIPGSRIWILGVYDEEYYLDKNTSEGLVNIYGESYLNLTSAGDKYYRNRQMTWVAQLTDEFDQNAYMGNYTCTWYFNGTLRGTSSTNSTGACSRTEATDCTWSFGSFPVNVSVTGSANPYYVMMVNDSYGDVTLVDLISITAIDSPVNDSTHHKGDNISLSSTAVGAECGYDPNSMEWFTSTGKIADGEDTYWEIPISFELGPENITVNATGNYSSTPYSHQIVVYGYSNVDYITPYNSNYLAGTIVTVSCKIVDQDTRTGIYNHSVSFYKNGTQMTANTTNILGVAQWIWNTSAESGLWDVSCNISDAPEKYYTASSPSEAHTNISIGVYMDITNITVENDTIYRSNSDTPNQAKVTVTVAKSDVNPVSGATVTFEFPDNVDFCTTDAAGTCSVYYNPGDTTAPNNYSIRINATKPGESPATPEYTYIAVKGKLFINVDEPSAGTSVHRGSPIGLGSTVADENGNSVSSVLVTWNTTEGQIATGEDALWTVAINQTLGLTDIVVYASKDFFDPNSSTTNLTIWGWAFPTWVSPKYEMGYGIPSILVCEVNDSNTSEGVPLYNITFWYNNTVIGVNTTNGSGQATQSFTPSFKGTLIFMCSIGDAPSLYYNASVNESQDEEVSLFVLRRFYGDVLDALGGGTPTTFKLYSPGTSAVTKTFITDSAGRYDVYVYNKTSDLEVSFANNSIKLYGIDFTSIADDPIDADSVSGTETTLVNDVKGFGVNTTLFTSNATIRINYLESDVVLSEDYLSIYMCAEWNYTPRNCLSGWTQLKDSVVNKPLNHVSVNVTNLTTSGATAYMLAESLPEVRPPKIGQISLTPNPCPPGSDLDLTVSVSDTDLVDVNATLTGHTVRLTYDDTTGYYGNNTLTAPLSDGLYAVNITASDSEGNFVYDDSMTLVVDSGNPEITIISPPNGSHIRSGTVINLSVSDLSLDSVWYSLNDGANNTLAPPHEIDTIGWIEATYNTSVWANDTLGHLTREDYVYTINDTVVVFTLSDIYANSIQPGGTITAHVNVTSGFPIHNITLKVTAPDTTHTYYLMTNDSETHYTKTITGYTTLGDHNLTATAVDTQGNTLTTYGWFEVYTLRNFHGDITDATGAAVTATFNLYRPGTTQIIQSFTTDSNGKYNTTIRERTADMEVVALSTKLVMRNVNLTSVNNDPLNMDPVSGSDVYILGKKGISGVALSSSLSASGSVEISYDDSSVSDESQLTVYECPIWEYDTRTCNSNWTELTASVDRTKNNISSDITALKTYLVFESLRCGNGVCEADYGESCFNCQLDCGECDVAKDVNLSILGRRPKTVDLSPIEDTLVEHSKLLEELKDKLEGFGIANLTAIEGRLVDQALSVDELRKLILMAREAQALIPGLQIVSADLYPGETIKTNIHINNVVNDTALVFVNAAGKILDFITFENPVVELEPLGEGDITFVIYIPIDTMPGTYFGEIHITSGEIKSAVPVNLRVLETREKILDLKISPLAEEVFPGDTLRIESTIYNLGGRAKVIGGITLDFLDIKTNEIITSTSDNITVETTLTLVRGLKIPQDTKEGRYVIRGTIAYQDRVNNTQFVTDITYVTVRKSFFQLTFFGVPIWLTLVTVFTLSGIYIIYLIRKRQLERRRRYLESLALEALPQPGPRSGFIGRVAETDFRAFIEIDKG